MELWVKLKSLKYNRIIVLLIILALFLLGLLITDNISRRRYEKKQATAEDYLLNGDYEQAIKTFRQAMNMKNSNKELLSIGLAEAYCGINDYDKALEVLRESYIRKNSDRIKVLIEQTNTRKLDYEYGQIINRAENYFVNEEYERAISEYEKAKTVKSQEVISYHRIAESYLKMKQYSLAKEEAEEGIVITQREELRELSKRIDEGLMEEEYNKLLNEAQEYKVQENYEQAAYYYIEAIRILPRKETAYVHLAEIYILIQDYDKAIHLLENTLQTMESEELKERFNEAKALLGEREERKRILTGLYDATFQRDVEKILSYMNHPLFISKIAAGGEVFYSKDGEGTILNGKALIIYNQDSIYAGDIREGMKRGIGTSFIRKGSSWTMYQGEWNNDIPDGVGDTITGVIEQDE